MAFAAMVELGIPALLCLGLIIAMGLWRRLQQLQQDTLSLEVTQPSLLAGLLLACASVLIYSNLTGIGLTPVSQLLMLLIVGTLISCKDITITTQTKLKQVLWLVLILFTFTALWSSWQDLTTGQYQLFVPGQNDPRFWLNGHYYHR